MSAPLFEHVRELIMQHRYDEARRILETIDHPTAHKWLTKLDELSPPVKPIKKSWLSQSRVLAAALTGVVIVMLIVFTGVIVFLALQLRNQGSMVLVEDGLNEREREALIIFCMSEDETLGRVECSNVADFIYQDAELWNTTSHCLDAHIDNLPAFSICMRDVISVLEERQSNEDFQLMLLMQYCSGRVALSTFGEECETWASQVAFLFPARRSMSQCWNTDDLANEYFNGTYAVNSDAGRVNLYAAVDCIKQAVGENLPPLPPCVHPYNERATCNG